MRNKKGHISEFPKLKETELRDLGTRINVLCDNYDIPRIHEDNPHLWQGLNNLLEEARHFIIHPFPDPAKFQEFMKTVQEKQKYRKWARIAEEVIFHFVKNLKERSPPWLKQNQFFAIEGVKVSTRPEWLRYEIKES